MNGLVRRLSPYVPVLPFIVAFIFYVIIITVTWVQYGIDGSNSYQVFRSMTIVDFLVLVIILAYIVIMFYLERHCRVLEALKNIKVFLKQYINIVVKSMVDALSMVVATVPFTIIFLGLLALWFPSLQEISAIFRLVIVVVVTITAIALLVDRYRKNIGSSPPSILVVAYGLVLLVFLDVIAGRININIKNFIQLELLLTMALIYVTLTFAITFNALVIRVDKAVDIKHVEHGKERSNQTTRRIQHLKKETSSHTNQNR